MTEQTPVTPRALLRSLFDTAVAAADPMRVVAPALPPRPTGRLIVIGAGKASARMAEAVEAHYGSCEGYVITRYGYARPCQTLEIVEAAHPVPDAAGEAATLELLDRVADLGPDDLVLALISGGGSSLLVAPVEGLTLADKMEVNATLLASGAPISDMNSIRKGLSRVKGGKLAAACHPAQVHTLMISDVPGDDPAMIASGPTVGTSAPTTPVSEVLHRHGITLPNHVLEALEQAEPALVPEDPRLRHATHQIIAAPSMSLDAAAQLARDHGLTVRLLGDALEGEARDLGFEHAQLALDVQNNMSPDSPPTLLMSGGECTVTRRGDGIGGPNAEYALAAMDALSGAEGIHLIACDTDGVDGAAEVAGAYVGPDSLTRAAQMGLDPNAALADNDAHSFFEKLGDQIVPGPTLTNVNDFRAIAIYPRKG